MTNVWKIAPGGDASLWDICHKKGCIALGWNELSDFSAYFYCVVYGSM